jgi:hypothetical protein
MNPCSIKRFGSDYLGLPQNAGRVSGEVKRRFDETEWTARLERPRQIVSRHALCLVTLKNRKHLGELRLVRPLHHVLQTNMDGGVGH